MLLTSSAYAQGIKSISIHNNDNPEGWLYGLNEIDSITIDDDGIFQILNIEGYKVFHKINDVNSVTFSEKDPPVFYSFVKLLNDTACYVMNNTGYVRTCADDSGNITELDAYINDLPINIRINKEQKIQSIRTDSLDLYFDYQNTQVVIYGRFFSAVICDTLNYTPTENAKMKILRKSGSVDSFWMHIVKAAGDHIKDFAVEKGIDKILGVEFSAYDSYDDAVRKSQLRSSLKNLMGIAETMQEIQQFGEMRVEDIAREAGEMPDLGGIENATYFYLSIDSSSPLARFLKWILPILKKKQEHNNAIIEQREKGLNRPTLILDIKTGDVTDVTSNSAKCSIDGVIRAEANKGEFNFEYGICYSTSSHPTIAQNVKSTIESDDFFSSISLSLPIYFKLSSLAPNTTYYYRAFLKDKITGNIIYADNTKHFKTSENVLTSCPDDHHPHMIDLGLPSGTKWACCNVGASAPEQYGSYFAWGETSPKSYFSWENYAYYNSNTGGYNYIGSDIAGTSYDAATANWGSPWVMPSLDQMNELKNNCTSEWTTENGVNGSRFTGPNGASIFLPAAGYRWEDDLDLAGSNGYYWSSALDGLSTDGAWYLLFGFGGVYARNGLRHYYGLSVRPVRRN